MAGIIGIETVDVQTIMAVLGTEHSEHLIHIFQTENRYYYSIANGPGTIHHPGTSGTNHTNLLLALALERESFKNSCA